MLHMLNPLYARVVDWSNLLLAYRKAAKGKRSRQAAAGFEHQLADRLLLLEEELSNFTYRPCGYHSFTIHDPKERRISAAEFRDRVVHHALCQVIEPIFEEGFIAESYANRSGKGTHRAIDRLQQLSRRYRYVLRSDIVQHFPSIDHEILFGIISETIRDEQVLWLIDRIIRSGEGVLVDEYEMVFF
ncbi:MAG: RNA-dependent DNA polymerase, partial [Blastocatellia bacterium]